MNNCECEYVYVCMFINATNVTAKVDAKIVDQGVNHSVIF